MATGRNATYVNQSAKDAVAAGKDPTRRVSLAPTVQRTAASQQPQQPQQPQAPQQPAYQTPGGYQVTGGYSVQDPSASEYAYGKYSPQLGQAGYTEQMPNQGRQAAYAVPGAVDAVQGRTVSQGVYGAASPGLRQQSATEQYVGNTTIDPSQTASGQYYASLIGKDIVPQDVSPYFDRARQKGAAGLDKAAAARGMFGSSAAMDQQRELQADLGAAEAKANADYALEAALAKNNIFGTAASRSDAAGLDRYSTLLGGATASDQGKLSRMGLEGELGGLADRSGLSRYVGEAGVAEGADRYGLDVATQKDAALRGRLGLLGQGASAADQGRFGRVNTALGATQGTTGAYMDLVGGSLADLIGTDQGYIDQMSQLGLGSGLAQLSGAGTNAQLQIAQGQQLGQNIGNSINNGGQQALQWINYGQNRSGGGGGQTQSLDPWKR